MIRSDKDRLEDELEKIEIALLENENWTPEIARLFIRREEIRKDLKRLGNKEWFK